MQFRIKVKNLTEQLWECENAQVAFVEGGTGAFVEVDLMKAVKRNSMSIFKKWFELMNVEGSLVDDACGSFTLEDNGNVIAKGNVIIMDVQYLDKKDKAPMHVKFFVVR